MVDYPSSAAPAACTRCGNQLAPGEAVCRACGTPAAPRGPEKSRSGNVLTAILLASALAVVLLLIVVTSVLVLPGLVATSFRTAGFVPQDSFTYSTVSLKPGIAQRWYAKSVLDTFTSQPGFESALRSNQTTMSGTSEVDFNRDVLPLLEGEIGFALTGNVTSPRLVTIVRSSDSTKLMDLIARSNRAPAATDTYRGVTVNTRLGRDGNPNTAGAAAQEWLVLGYDATGSGRLAVEQTLDRISGGASGNLAESQRYRQLVERLPIDRLGLIYVDTSSIIATLTAQGGQFMTPEVRQYADQFVGRAAVAIAAGNESLNFHWESVPERGRGKPATSTPGDIRSAFKLLPPDALAVWSTHDASAYLAQLDEVLTRTINTNAPPNNRLNLQFTQWLGGEAAVGVSKGTLRLNNNSTSGTMDVYAVAKVKDKTAAQREIESFDSIAKPQTISLQNVPFREIRSGSESLAYGLLGDYLYLSFGQHNRLLDARNGSGLQGNARYQSVEEAISRDGIGFFVDLEAGRQLAEEVMRPNDRREFEQRVRPFLLPLRAFGGSTRIDSDGAAHGRLILKLGK
ncbi:MAG: DUF3352 domain-containing protein [Chloroflexi bacterium]|nr:DUF3352 domain-containing protein [Chloroflexota bacterium]